MNRLTAKVITLVLVGTFSVVQQLSAQCGNINIAKNKTVTTSSNGAGTLASYVTDSSASTAWQPSYGSANWAYVDLGASYTVCRVNVKWIYYNVASSFTIQMATSNPGTESSWSDIATVTSNNPTEESTTGAYNTWYKMNVLNITSTANTGRYVRILIGTISGANWAVSELEVNKATTNVVPGVSLTAPTNAVTIEANTPLDLTATASDPDGTVTEVAFYDSATLLGLAPQTASPYHITWTPTTAGTYKIKAKAKDNNDGVGQSLSVTVTVTPPNSGWGLLGNTSTTLTDSSFIGTKIMKPLVIKTNNSERLRINEHGRVLIGSTQLSSSAPSNTLLAVNGYIMAKGVKVTQLSSNWPDYVFASDYKLMPLPELANFIKNYQHLPGVPNAEEVKSEGISLAENQAILLKKIEELTLYILKQQEEIEKLKKQSQKK